MSDPPIVFSDPSRARRGWTVLVPVKPLGLGKSRLREYDAPTRATLALAFAEDTVAAALAAARVDRVVVVTSDDRVANTVRSLGAEARADPVPGDLNACLREVARTFAGEPVAALCADLPALTPAALDDALRAAGRRPAFVADRQGRGTTLLCAPNGAALAPSFGIESATRHRAAGYAQIEAAEVLRLDVDDATDLQAAVTLDAGAATRRALASLSSD